MKTRFITVLIIFLFFTFQLAAQSISVIDTLLPVRGFCIAAPRPDNVDRFVEFVKDELYPMNVNTLVLRVDFNYQYNSHPELRDSVALSKDDVKKLVEVCRDHNIRIIPQREVSGSADCFKALFRKINEMD